MYINFIFLDLFRRFNKYKLLFYFYLIILINSGILNFLYSTFFVLSTFTILSHDKLINLSFIATYFNNPFFEFIRSIVNAFCDIFFEIIKETVVYKYFSMTLGKLSNKFIIGTNNNEINSNTEQKNLDDVLKCMPLDDLFLKIENNEKVKQESLLDIIVQKKIDDIFKNENYYKSNKNKKPRKYK